jgi:hypothetical protein
MHNLKIVSETVTNSSAASLPPSQRSPVVPAILSPVFFPLLHDPGRKIAVPRKP